MAPFSISSAITLGLALLSCVDNVCAQYPDPNDDPFYAVPATVGSHPPGYVLKSRAVSTPNENLNVAASYQLLYRTTNQQGNATATVGTLWVPTTPKSPPKILLYSTAYDSLNIDCAPSWAFVNSSSNAPAYINGYEAPVLVGFAASKGYYVVNTDAEGPTAALLVGNIEGKSALDGVKAAINFRGLARPSVALYGYSGGAHTSVWAASVAKGGYAPEFDIVGAAFGGTPVDLGATYQLIDNTTQSDLAAASIFGLGNGYPDLNATLTSLLTPLGKQVSTAIRRRNNCVPNEMNNDGVPQSVETLFTHGPRGIPQFESVLKEQDLVSTATPYPIPVPSFPRLEYHGSNDTTVPYHSEAEYVSQQCNSGKGAQIWFSTLNGADHAGAGILGFLGALAFVSSALDGVNLTPPSCGAGTAPMPVPGSADAKNLLGTSLSNYLCQHCSCC